MGVELEFLILIAMELPVKKTERKKVDFEC